MSAFATEPLTFTAARDYLERKVSLPTTLSSLELSLNVPARIRGQAFFSARVASATILQNLRKEAEAIARGDYNYAEGRLRMKEFLAKQGYGIPQPGEKGDGALKDIASTRRLNLILEQNVAMAHAVGQREVAEHPAVMEMLPCYEYSTGPNPRPEHAAFDGLVLPKNDPFWSTHYPPWDFNCNCMVLDTDAEPNGKTSGFGGKAPADGHLDYKGMRQMSGNESGFEFSSDPREAFAAPDFSTIEAPDLRAQVEQAWKGKAAVLGLGRAPLVASAPVRQRASSTEPASDAAGPVARTATPAVGRVTPRGDAGQETRPTNQQTPAPQTSRERAFQKVTKPLREKVSFGDEVAWLQDGVLRLGRISGPDNGAGVLVRTAQGPARVARADLRHPENFRGSPES